MMNKVIRILSEIMPGWLAVLVAAPVGAALGGLLSAAIVVLVSLPFEGPATSFRPELIGIGIMVGLSVTMWLMPAVAAGIHMMAKGWPQKRYEMAMGWGCFLFGGAIPYLSFPSYQEPLVGLVSGMASAWAFVKVTKPTFTLAV